MSPLEELMAAQRYRTAGYGAMVESETGQRVTDVAPRPDVDEQTLWGV